MRCRCRYLTESVPICGGRNVLLIACCLFESYRSPFHSSVAQAPAQILTTADATTPFYSIGGLGLLPGKPWCGGSQCLRFSFQGVSANRCELPSAGLQLPVDTASPAQAAEAGGSQLVLRTRK